MTITYWSDYACPYCYIGVRRLKKAVADVLPETGARIVMRSFELDPDAPLAPVSDTATRFARKYGLSLAGANARIEQISSLGRAEGIDLRYATTRYTRTFDAHRLTHYARSLGDDAKTAALEERLYAAYFTDNLELADRKTLLDAAESVGLDRAEAERVLASDRFARDVRRDEREAAEAGVHGVPYFVIDGKVAVPGAASTDDLRDLLRTMAADSARAAEPSAPSCGPDGCAWRP